MRSVPFSVRNFNQQSDSLARLLVMGWLCLAGCYAWAAAPAFPAGDLEFFEKRIRPLLAERCYECHSAGAKKVKGDLHLDSREAILKGGETRPAVVPGQPEKSLLLEAVRYGNQDLQMPPKSRLSDAQVADLTEWVKRGAAWPPEAANQRVAKQGFDVQQRKQAHWSWQPPRSEPVPAVKNSTWSQQPVDRFLLAKLEAKQLQPATPAAPLTLLRRLHFDLTGLPPKPEDVEAFTRSLSHSPTFSPAPARAGEQVRKRESEPNIERVVDSLLSSPAFGERWARHWLDLVRYAETRGHEFEPIIPNAWQYRDYVIRALNADVPYNQFVTEHLAGDLVAKPRLNPATGGNESILGTGFWFLGEEVHSPVDIRQDECDRMDNRLDVMSKTFLGMTVACARCHDHKFDAISQRDYYALAGFLISSTYRQAPFAAMETHREVAAQLAQLRAAEQSKLLQATAQALRPGLERFTENLLSPTPTPAWTAALQQAKGNPDHPLHDFAPAGERPAEPTKPVARRARRRVAQPAAAVTDPQPASLVVDYARPGPKDWVQDGWSFGSRPATPGEILLGPSENQPLAGIVSRAAAVRDPAWNRFATKGVERDVGTLGEWDRSGQTLRTPDVTLTAGSLWYLVRGPVRAYANVASHLIIKGPLHGALLREFKDDLNHWRWVEHPLATYRGQRVHAEFSPVGAAPLAIAAVVQADAKPPLPEAPDDLLQAALSADEVNSPATIAAALQRTSLAVAAEMETGRVSPAAAPLADWLVQNLDLFCPPGSPARQQLAAAAKPALARRTELTARLQPVTEVAPAMLDGTGVDELLLVRGQPRNPAGATPRRFLEALAGTAPAKFTTGSGRLELALQIVDPANPFTARVIVNRVWHHLFGRGLVPSVDNFGVLGQPPSHPELLDHLAVHFTRDLNWSVKRLIRELVLTQAYQMSSAPADARTEQLDPENALLHRMNLRRLEGEAIRDAVLTVSGRLDPKLGGTSVMVHLTPFMDGRGKPSSGPLDGAGRRSIYTSVRRNFLPPMMLAFDMPIPFTTMGRRNVSNVPAQALILMNDPFIVEQTRVWSKRLASVPDPAERVRQMYLAAFARPPVESELKDALTFITEQSQTHGASPTDDRVWADLAHVLFNVKEFIYLN